MLEANHLQYNLNDLSDFLNLSSCSVFCINKHKLPKSKEHFDREVFWKNSKNKLFFFTLKLKWNTRKTDIDNIMYRKWLPATVRSLKTIEIAKNSFQKVGVVQKQNLLELILLEILLKFIQRFPGRWNVPLMESLAGLQLEKK